MIWILLFLLCIITLFSYYYFQSDLFSPTFLFNAGFLAATAVAALNEKVWGVDLSAKTIMIVLLANVAFFLGNCFGERVRIIFSHSSSTHTVETNEPSQLQVIQIRKYKYYVVIIFGIFTAIYQFSEVNRVASYALAYYQNIGLMASYKSALAENNISNLLQQLLRLYGVSTQVLTFVFIYNYKIVDKRDRHIFLNGIIVGIYIVQCLLQGGRGTLINYFVYILFLVYYVNFLHGKVARNNRNFGFRFILRSGLAIAVFLVVFYAGMGLVGRTSDSNFFTYISSYIGSSIEMLDLYIRNPGSVDKPFLGETMPVFINFFKRLGLLPGDIIKVTLEYRSTPTGLTIGNIYTALRRYYHDLSWGGIIVFPFLMATFFSVYYRRIKTQIIGSARSIFNVVVYGSLLGCIILQAMEDSFFLYKVTPGYLFELIIIRIMITILV